MNNPSMDQWISHLGGNNNDGSNGNRSTYANDDMGSTDGMNPGGATNYMAAHNMMNMQNANSNGMYVLNNLNNGNVTGIPSQEGQTNFLNNNGHTPQNNHNHGYTPQNNHANDMQMQMMNGFMNRGGFQQNSNNQAVRIQVKTGEAVDHFHSMGMLQPQAISTFKDVGNGHHNHSHHNNRNNGEMGRSNSEPMLNNMMGMVGNEDFGINNIDQARLASTDMMSNIQQFERGGISIDNQNNLLGSNRTGSGDNEHNLFGSNCAESSMMGNPNSNNVMTHSSSSGGHGNSSNRHDRRHSEPAMNLLADIFDESAHAVESIDAGVNMGGPSLEHNNNMPRSADGWSSPPPQQTAVDRSNVIRVNTVKQVNTRRRSNSAPLISDMMFDLDNLEPEKIFDEGTSSAKHKSETKNQFNTFNLNETRRGTGQVKRSRSIDPVEMFRHSIDGGSLFTNQIGDSNNSSHSRLNDSAHGEAHNGFSQDGQKSEAKRRRSAPLLTNDIFADLFNTDETEASGKHQDGGQSNPSFAPDPFPQNQPFAPPAPQDQSFAQGPTPQDHILAALQTNCNTQLVPNVAPQDPQDTRQYMQQGNNVNHNVAPQDTPQNTQQGNNVNLIEMLLGIGHRTDRAPQGAYDTSGAQETHQQITRPTHQLKPIGGDSVPQQQHPSIGGDSVPQQQHPSNVPMAINSVSHQQMVTSSMLQQQMMSTSGPLANNPMSHQQISSNSGAFVSDSNPLANQMMFSGEVASAPTSSSQAPPPLNINNSEDLSLVLSAVKETQTNLRTLQPMVMQLGDPVSMEEIATAFKITASSSQFVLASDLPSAYSALNDAWATINKLENRLAQGSQQQQLLNLANNNSTFAAGMMEQMMFPQSVQNQLVSAAVAPSSEAMPNQSSVIDLLNQPQGLSILSSNNTYIPDSKMKKKAEKVKSDKPATPTGRPKSVVGGKTSPLPSKSKPKAKKGPSSPPSPLHEVVELEDLPPVNKENPDVIMQRLQGFMDRTQNSQKQLQRWDKKNGLPKSHSQTMVNSSRSRRQLQKGVILKKWNGDPLISGRQVKQNNQSEEEHSQKTHISSEEAGQNNIPLEQSDGETSGDPTNANVTPSDTPMDSEIPGQKNSEASKDDDIISMDPSEILKDEYFCDKKTKNGIENLELSEKI